MLYCFAVILLAMLAALSWIDLRTYRLPNVLTFPLIAMGIVQAYLLGLGWQNSLIGAALGYAVFVAIELAFKHIRGKDGLGRGDAKLLAAGGAWCGWMGLPLIVLIASGMGLLALLFPSFRKSSNAGRIPFGPFLALGIICVWGAMRLSELT